MILIKVLIDGVNGGVYVIILLIRALVNDHQSTPMTTRAGNEGKTKPSFVQPKPFWWPITICVQAVLSTGLVDGTLNFLHKVWIISWQL